MGKDASAPTKARGKKPKVDRATGPTESPSKICDSEDEDFFSDETSVGHSIFEFFAKKFGHDPGVILRPTSVSVPEDLTVIPAALQAWVCPEHTFCSSKDASFGIVLLLTLLGFLTRFWLLWHPTEVVFDEVHFGKFANFYLRRQYFFDIHPPLGKLVLALAANVWDPDYKGDFAFDNIEDKYHAGVPFLALRFMPAFLSALTVPLSFFTARAMGRSLVASTLVASFVLLDTALICQFRLILIDSFLFFFVVLAVLCSWGLRNCASDPERVFSAAYWSWLVAAGISVGCAASVKWTGLAVLAGVGLHHFLCGLGNIRDYTRRSKDVAREWKDFMVRCGLLAVLPVLVYIAIQAIHFHRLSKSGEGDGFMTQAFRADLDGSLPANERYYGPPLTFFQKMWELTKTMYVTNKGILEPHPWMSAWWTWPLNQRGIHYWQGKGIPNPDGGPELVSRVYLLGNPIIWWLTSAALPLALLVALYGLLFEIPFSLNTLSFFSDASLLLVQYLMNILPYVPVARSTFLYHYFPALFFANLMTATVLDHMFRTRPLHLALTCCSLLAAAAFGFYYWSFFAYGLPLEPRLYEKRVWFESWR